MQIDPTLRALADQTRLRIMRLLAHMELAVGELAQVLGQSQPRVSRHVRILCDAGLAERRKEGSWVFLKTAIRESVAPPPERDDKKWEPVFVLKSRENKESVALYDSILSHNAIGAATARLLAVAERDDPGFAARCSEDRRHLAAIRAAREATAASYFARFAAEWDSIRSLHSPDAPVEQALLGVLGPALGALLDIGTGTGRMAEMLAVRASHVTAFDKSPEMLRIARARLQHLPAAQVDLVQGDFTALPFADGQFDTVLFHQVLHYAQAPELALAEAARVLRPGGCIAVVDFAAHDREELRSAHAHARLGFTEEQMLALFSEAGLRGDVPVALPGKPLTVKIWVGRRPVQVGHSTDQSLREAPQP
ncbi:MAG: metalloregulator ArsR/SmtB family transcription factor [Pseudomonadota bacterium]|nr:metalloregulator ArsR/SmtB family transcription factor [Pseudomonadota bacterium]